MEAGLTLPAAASCLRRPLYGSRFTIAAVTVVVAVMTRAVTFGNPAVNVDDQFYLLVGDAMRDGAWPYIDVWDRKPPGLFLLFGAIAAICNGSILGMQLIATAFAAATAFSIQRIARLFVSDEPALLAAVAYLFMLPLFGGQSGQSPIFYNLLIASAAWLTLRAASRPDRPAHRTAHLSMLLAGLAISIKQVAVAEGALFGLVLLWLFWRQGMSASKLALRGAAMIATALLPMAVFFLPYVFRGDEARDAFIYANFVSIFDKDSLGATAKFAGLGFFFLYAAPLLVLAGIGVKRCYEVRRSSAAAVILLGWLGAAGIGYLMVPLFFEHYALPLLVPLCVAAAIAFSAPFGRYYAGGLILFCVLQGISLDLAGNRRTTAIYAELSARIDEARGGGCLYLADGPSWLYATTGACRITPYLFPAHLNFNAERNALGVRTDMEMARILRQRPAVIVTPWSRQIIANPVVETMLWAMLERDYRTVYSTPHHGSIVSLRVWQRRDLGFNSR